MLIPPFSKVVSEVDDEGLVFDVFFAEAYGVGYSLRLVLLNIVKFYSESFAVAVVLFHFLGKDVSKDNGDFGYAGGFQVFKHVLRVGLVCDWNQLLRARVS